VKQVRRNILEHRVYEELGDLLTLRYTSGSGNQLGDADLKPRYYNLSNPVEFGIECKQTSRGKNHNVKYDEFQKALKQVGMSGRMLLFCTQAQTNDVLVHMRLEDFKTLLEIIHELLQQQPDG
jgi:hypothetical protein